MSSIENILPISTTESPSVPAAAAAAAAAAVAVSKIDTTMTLPSDNDVDDVANETVITDNKLDKAEFTQEIAETEAVLCLVEEKVQESQNAAPDTRVVSEATAVEQLKMNQICIADSDDQTKAESGATHGEAYDINSEEQNDAEDAENDAENAENDAEDAEEDAENAENDSEDAEDAGGAENDAEDVEEDVEDSEEDAEEDAEDAEEDDSEDDAKDQSETQNCSNFTGQMDQNMADTFLRSRQWSHQWNDMRDSEEILLIVPLYMIIIAIIAMLYISSIVSPCK
jgi:hypothetical protein